MIQDYQRSKYSKTDTIGMLEQAYGLVKKVQVKKWRRLGLDQQSKRRQLGAVSVAVIAMFLSVSPCARAQDSVPSNPSSPSEATGDNLQPGLPSHAATPNEEDSQLPPGHPSIDATAQVNGAMPDTGADTGMPTSSDAMGRSTTVPIGTIEVHVANDANKPVAGAALILQLHRESVAEGNTDAQRELVTDTSGVARFDRLSTDSAYSYRVMLNTEGVKYGPQPFQLTGQAGVSLRLHQYPLVHDLKQALVATESLLFVEPRDDVFQFEVVYQIYNIGQTIWVPENVSVHLSNELQAFNTQQSTDDVRVESTGTGVRLVGAVPPGQHQVTYTFHVPRHNTANASFEFELPPNVMQAKVGLASSRGAELTVEDFPDAQPNSTQNGQRLLLTSKSFDRANQLPTDLRFQVLGLPTVGIGRVVAAVVAILLAVLGLLFALAKSKNKGQSKNEPELLQDRARDRLLSELAELEGAKLTGQIGPRTYQETRSTIMAALIRLEPMTE